MYLLPGLGGVGLCYGPCVSWASLVAQMVKHLHTIQETLVPTRGWEDPLEKGIVLLPGEFHGQRSLVGYSPWGLKELNMTE